MSYLKSVGTTFIYIGAFLALITFMPGLPPDVDFEEYSLVYPKKLSGNLGVNQRLNNAEILFQGDMKNSRAFASYNGELYTGIEGGHIVKIVENKVVPLVNIGKECDGLLQKCSTPLGLKFDSKGFLYVSDGLNGIFKIDVKAKKYEKFISSESTVDGKKSLFINSLDVASNGDIYYSVSSTEITIDEAVYITMSNPSGRLIRYNAATKKNEVLLNDLGYPSGVILSENEEFVLVAESLKSQIIKYNIKGSNANKAETFIEGLPGLPDNIYSDNIGGFLVSLVKYADAEHPQLSQTLAPHPFLRRMFARLVTVFRAPIKLLAPHYPDYARVLVPYVKGFESWLQSSSEIVTVLRINHAGKIIDAAYGVDERVSGCSSAFIFNEFLWLGFSSQNYISKVPLKQAFPTLANTSQR
ncbi:hypothetical protein QAD02_019756 [Eretmocerus hayati]|uniref:Uncharacterized protein n=1 Tax=Eretmocerus hayati TaxID=131215 RepID=A0ACC2PK44_9HYME|nr:hypothetical protein QAD02_019756 [Eretmocerus hayati]